MTGVSTKTESTAESKRTRSKTSGKAKTTGRAAKAGGANGTTANGAKTAGAKANGAKANGTKTGAKSRTKKWTSRAVTRLIEAGSMTDCEHCDERVKFRAREKQRQVICNVYESGRWNRVEHYHENCYAKAGLPYGDPLD